jgi:hypothetical protein
MCEFKINNHDAKALKKMEGPAWGSMPVISATQEDEIRRIAFQGSPCKKVVQTSSQQRNWAW